MVADDLGELHLVPEVVQVQDQPEHYDSSQDVHVPGSPAHPCGHCRHRIALVAAGRAVTQRQDRCIDDVHQETGGQHQRSHQCVPVGTQEFTDRIVSLGRENGRQVHRHVKQQEKNQKET